jgi:aspartate oxidase
MDFDQDSFTKHIEDTLVAGDGLCNENIVEIVVKEGVDRINELIEWGAKFDKEPDGDYKLGKEGGHSESRILHHKDVTGKEMERALINPDDYVNYKAHLKKYRKTGPKKFVLLYYPNIFYFLNNDKLYRYRIEKTGP